MGRTSECDTEISVYMHLHVHFSAVHTLLCSMAFMGRICEYQCIPGTLCRCPSCVCAFLVLKIICYECALHSRKRV